MSKQETAYSKPSRPDTAFSGTSKIDTALTAQTKPDTEFTGVFSGDIVYDEAEASYDMAIINYDGATKMKKNSLQYTDTTKQETAYA